jgi:hypothetical protein
MSWFDSPLFILQYALFTFGGSFTIIYALIQLRLSKRLFLIAVLFLLINVGGCLTVSRSGVWAYLADELEMLTVPDYEYRLVYLDYGDFDIPWGYLALYRCHLF